jgi:glycine cleavage system aminomethyltransferase T
MATKGGASHALVGLALAAGPLPAQGSPLWAESARVGELTSAGLSASAGAIALGFVRRPHAAPGTALEVAGGSARVAALPFVAPGARAP